MKNDVASGSAKLSLIKVVVLHPTTMGKDQCYLISSKRPKETIRENNPKIQADYCNTVPIFILYFLVGTFYFLHFKNDILFIRYTLILFNKQIGEEEKDLRKCSFSSDGKNRTIKTVSYTHLTLPTILRV